MSTKRTYSCDTGVIRLSNIHPHLINSDVCSVPYGFSTTMYYTRPLTYLLMCTADNLCYNHVFTFANTSQILCCIRTDIFISLHYLPQELSNSWDGQTVAQKLNTLEVRLDAKQKRYKYCVKYALIPHIRNLFLSGVHSTASPTTATTH